MRRNLLAAAIAVGCLSATSWAQSNPPGRAAPDVPPAERRDAPPSRRPPPRGQEPPVRLEKGAYLGVATSPAPKALRRQVGLPDGVGLVVDAVAPDCPAGDAGLKQHDLLHKFNDQVLINPQQLAVLVRMHKPEDSVSLTVLRGGKPVEVSAKLVERDLRPLEDMRLGADPRLLEDRFEPFDPRRGDPNRRPLNPDPARPFPPGMLMTEDFTLVWDDGVIAMSVAVVRGHKTLVAKDKDGKELFNGPVDTEEQRKALPKEIRDRLPHVGPPGLFRGKPQSQPADRTN